MSAQRVGRHRLGQPGLRYCRDIPEIRARLEPAVSRNPHGATTTRRIRPALVFGAAAAAGAAIVGGWMANGATALADILGR